MRVATRDREPIRSPVAASGMQWGASILLYRVKVRSVQSERAHIEDEQLGS